MRRGRIRKSCAHWVFVVLVVLSTFSWSQDGSSSERETISSLVQQIKELRRHDRELQERIRLLEAGQKVAPVPDASPSGPDVPHPVETDPAPPSLAMRTLRGIQMRGFAEVNYKVLDQRAPETGAYGFVPGSAGNFYTGDFDLFLTSRLTDRTSVLSEIDFEGNDAQSFKLDLRRLLLKYDVNDHLKLSFGRYQTSIGYYNWAFRSAAWLQTTADRPLVMEFANNGGLLPTQAVGVSVTGNIPSGKLGLHYIAEYGSSDTIRPDINGDSLLNDENNGNQINVGFFLEPDRIRGLRIGGSFYHDKISDLMYSALGGVTYHASMGAASPSARWGQTVVNAHLIYVSRRLEFLSEGFLIRHTLLGSSETFSTPAFYSQVSKRVGPIRPFARYQYVNANSQNSIYNDIGLRYGPSFGARYDLNDYIAFKAQLDHTVRGGLPDLNGLHLQMAVTF